MFAAGAGLRPSPEIPPHQDIGGNLIAWALGCAMIYTCLFGTGKLLLHQPMAGTLLLLGRRCARCCSIASWCEISESSLTIESDREDDVLPYSYEAIKTGE